MTQRCLRPPSGKAAQAAASLCARLPRIETERLLLRAATLADFSFWEGFFVGPNAAFKGSSEDAWDEYCNYMAGWLLHGHGLLAIERKETSVTLGFVLLGLEWGDLEPELGWMLAEPSRGQGFATEAATALRDHATDLLGPGNFVSYIYRDNAPSRRVADRLGATLEGTALGEAETVVYRHGARP